MQLFYQVVITGSKDWLDCCRGKWQPAVLKLKLVSQLASSPALQQGIAAFMAEGYYKRHLLKFRQQLQQQRDQLLQALQQDFPADCQYSMPSGGLALWLQLPQPYDTVALYQQCLTHGIYLTPGRSVCHQSRV